MRRVDTGWVIKYIGSKRTLLPRIVELVDGAPGVRTVLDLFSGTARVGHALKSRGYRVISNDNAAYAHCLARCYVQSDRERVERDARMLIEEFNAVRGEAGYFTETFCERSRFFRPENGARVDAIRELIARKGLDPELESVVMVSLMEAADRVDSTTGVQMAYLKSWAPRAMKDLELRMPDVLPGVGGGRCKALCLDAEAAAARVEADLVYVDPPYNQHSYLGNYHIWESLVRWDKPEVYGVACKRVDCRTRKSGYNSKRVASEVFGSMIARIRAPWIVVSFNDEGFIARDAMEAMLGELGDVTTIGHDYKRYVGAQIGIHNPSGERVGRVGRLRNTEYLFLVRTRSAAQRVAGERLVGAA